MIVSLGAVERTREGILEYVSRMIRRTIEASGVPEADLYTVESEYYRRVISGFTEYANDLGRDTGLVFTEAEIEAVIRAENYVEGVPGIAPTFGPRLKILHEAVDYSLNLFRVVVTPTAGTSSAVSDSKFAEYVEYAMRKANERGAQYGYSYTRPEVERAIVERGYLPTSDYATPTPTVTRTYTQPPTATERVRLPYERPPVYPTPTYQPPSLRVQPQPPAMEPAEAGAGGSNILTIVGFTIFGLALGSIIKGRQ
jgi:hypothetical protein